MDAGCSAATQCMSYSRDLSQLLTDLHDVSEGDIRITVEALEADRFEQSGTRTK